MDHHRGRRDPGGVRGVQRSKGCQSGGNRRQLSNPASYPQASGSWDPAHCWSQLLSGTHGRPEDCAKREEEGPPEEARVEAITHMWNLSSVLHEQNSHLYSFLLIVFIHMTISPEEPRVEAISAPVPAPSSHLHQLARRSPDCGKR